MGVLYRLTSLSGKAYIGISSKDLDSRWAKHVEHACGKRTAGALYAALRKYGPETFTREVLAEHDDWDTLRQMEIDAIRTHGTLAPRGYNITQGGEGTRNRLSPEARANIGRAQKARFARPEERARLLAWSTMGRQKVSDAAAVRREAKRAERAAYKASVEFKALHSASVRRSMATPATRAKVLACAAARSASPHWRARVSASKRGAKIKPCSDEHRGNIAEAQRRKWADPVAKAHRLAANATARQAKQAQKEAA